MRKSLKRRIGWTQSLVNLLIVVLFGSTLYFQRRWTVLRRNDEELSAAVQLLIIQAQQNVTPLEMPDTFAGRRVHHEFERPYFVIRVAGRELAATVPEDDFDSFEPPRQHPGRTTWFRYRGPYREAFEYDDDETFVLVGRHVGADHAELTRFALLLAAVGSVMVGLGHFCGRLVARTAVHPIDRISEVAKQLSARSLSGRIDAETMDVEFASLAETLNASWGRIEAAFDRQRRFTADASHEFADAPFGDPNGTRIRFAERTDG